MTPDDSSDDEPDPSGADSGEDPPEEPPADEGGGHEQDTGNGGQEPEAGGEQVDDRPPGQQGGQPQSSGQPDGQPRGSAGGQPGGAPGGQSSGQPGGQPPGGQGRSGGGRPGQGGPGQGGGRPSGQQGGPGAGQQSGPGAGPQGGPASGPGGGQQGGQPPGRGGGQQGGPPPGGGGRPPAQSAGRGGRGGGETSLARRIGFVALAVLLTVSLVAASGVFAASSTVLNAGYVADTMDQQGVYSEVESQAEDFMVDEARGSLAAPGILPNSQGIVTGAVRDAVTAQYVKQEVQRNINNLYDYLHGRTNTLQLSINPSPLVSNIGNAVATQINQIPVADLLQQPAIQDSFSGLGVDVSRIGQALEDPQTFKRVQSDIRQQVQQAGYTTQELKQRLREQTNLGNLPPDVKQSVYRLQGTIVDGMTTDMSYNQFKSQMEAARADFAQSVGAYAQQQVSQRLESSIDLTQRLDPGQRQKLNDGAGYVQLVDTLKLAFPVIALLLLLLILGLTHSISRTAQALGGSLVVVGIIGFAASSIAKGQATSAIRDATAGTEQFVRDTAIAIVDGLFGSFTTQSIILLVLGIVFIGVWFGIDRYQPEQIPVDWR